MILPGISGSFILLILGKYQYIMGVITSLVGNIGALWGSPEASSALFWESLAVMAVFGVGAVVGILGFSKFLHWLLARWHKETLVALAGFIIGSLVKVWPWSNTEAIVRSQFPEAAALAVAAEITKYQHLIDPQIPSAVIFAMIGFCLVTGIEIAGKIIAKKHQA
jgi:putative membrane protein